MDESSYATLCIDMKKNFPPDALSFLHSNISAVLLALNNALDGIDEVIRLSGKSSGRKDFEECWRAVVLARPVLTEIARLSQIVGYIQLTEMTLWEHDFLSIECTVDKYQYTSQTLH